jgi:hypothetical protein
MVFSFVSSFEFRVKDKKAVSEEPLWHQNTTTGWEGIEQIRHLSQKGLAADSGGGKGDTVSGKNTLYF